MLFTGKKQEQVGREDECQCTRNGTEGPFLSQTKPCTASEEDSDQPFGQTIPHESPVSGNCIAATDGDEPFSDRTPPSENGPVWEEVNVNQQFERTTTERRGYGDSCIDSNPGKLTFFRRRTHGIPHL